MGVYDWAVWTMLRVGSSLTDWQCLVVTLREQRNFYRPSRPWERSGSAFRKSMTGDDSYFPKQRI